MFLPLIVGCGENPTTPGLITDSGQDQTQILGRQPPPTRSSSVGESGDDTTATARAVDGEEGVNFADGKVALSPVLLEQEEFIISGEIKTAVRVRTALAPSKGTLFILLRLSRWAHAEDLAPIKFDDVVVTIRKHDTTSLWYFPDLWPGTTDMISIMPLEMLEKQELPRATAELHTITKEHKFVPYEPVVNHQHLVFSPPR